MDAAIRTYVYLSVAAARLKDRLINEEVGGTESVEIVAIIAIVLLSIVTGLSAIGPELEGRLPAILNRLFTPP